MNKERLYKVLLAPQVSEKSTVKAESERQFVFYVLRDATKAEIKNAVEHMFDVKVDHVRVCNVQGKAKRFGHIDGRRTNRKKAYVKLKSGFDLDFMGPQ